MNPSRPLALLLVLLLTACGAAPAQEETTTVFAMDTVMQLSVYGENGQETLEQASAYIRQLESLLSATDPGSEIYAANHAAGKPVPLSDDTAALLRRSLELCRETDGALDLSVYPVIQAWGFPTGRYRVPGAAELSGLLARVDYTQIRLEDHTLTLPVGMEIDLGAVAKGYTGDRLMELFRASGLSSALVSLGGNIQALGAKPDGDPWRIAVLSPAEDGYAGVLEVEDVAVITSGGYQRYFEQDGQTYWHIIDPDTGRPAKGGLVSVTIISASGVLGDALSTALFVMGKDRAAAFWRERDDFDFVLIGEDGTVTVSEGIADSFSLYEDWQDHTLEVVSR